MPRDWLKLELHPEKTKVVYCKDDDRSGHYPNERLDFLGFTFRPRGSKNRWGRFFINFSPAVSAKAAKIMHSTMRSWRLHLRSDKALDDLSRMFNPVLRGWINYYGSRTWSARKAWTMSSHRVKGATKKQGQADPA